MYIRQALGAAALLIVFNASLFGQGVPTSDMMPRERETIQTPSWEFEFERGLPTKETVELMYNALDFQPAVEVYIWATPMVHYDEWPRQMKAQLGLDYGDVAIWDKFCDPHTIGLTPNSYKLHLPANIPAKLFWAVTIYNITDGTMVDAPGQPFPTINGMDKPTYNDDGSIDLYFGPQKPDGVNDKNYLKTVAGRDFMFVIRCYGTPLSFFDQTWKPDNLVRIK